MQQDRQISVGEQLVREGLSVSKIENDNQQVIAVQRPRNKVKVIKEALEELEMAPEFASKCFYSIPYKNDQGGTTPVEGGSIGLAMMVARLWGNCATGKRYIVEKDDRVIVEGVFMDYETNFRVLAQYSVSKTYWSKSAKAVIPLRDDRLNMAIQSGMSKALRNAIFGAIPIPLRDGLFKKAKELAINPTGAKKKLTHVEVKEKVKMAILEFVKMGADKKTVDDYVLGLSMETDEEVLLHLKGIWNRLNDKDLSIEEAFGPVEVRTEPVKGAVKEGDIFRGEGDGK